MNWDTMRQRCQVNKWMMAEPAASKGTTTTCSLLLYVGPPWEWECMHGCRGFCASIPRFMKKGFCKLIIAKMAKRSLYICVYDRTVCMASVIRYSILELLVQLYYLFVFSDFFFR